MKRRHLLQLAISGLVLAGVTTSVQADKLADIKDAGKMRVAILQDYPPFGSVGPDMKLRGLDVDFANMIAEKLGTTVEFVPVTAPNRIPYLQTNKVDVIIGSLGKNAEREKVVYYSSAYAMTFNGVFGAPDLKVTGPENLDGRTLAVTRGSTQDLVISELAPDANIKRFEDSAGTQSAYLSGQADLFVTGNVTAFKVSENVNLPIETKFKLNNEGAYVGISKGETALMGEIDKGIAELKADGTLSALSMKWLGEPSPDDL